MPTGYGRQRGAAIVEFAIAAPLVMMLILVTLEMSLMLWAHMTLQYAVREGVRYAVVDHGNIGSSPACQDVVSVIRRNSMGMTSLLNATYYVEVNGTAHRLSAGEHCTAGMFGGRGDLVTVGLTGKWPLATPYLYALVSGGPAYQFAVAATMQNEED